ncbi:hypothetical protein [Streptomyces sp. NBC_01358]|uniref:hypothetical protein n=1 Tax=Streptomyces sp. NBC_01358 TaxID=2903837 RepID=UPI002E3145D6|nr:hypothetical protein [Streptomyces sp. NBC_01358]
MSAHLDPQRGAMVVVFVGIALILTGSGLASLMDDSSWRWLGTVGVLVQVVGWIRYSRVRRGGVR